MFGPAVHPGHQAGPDPFTQLHTGVEISVGEATLGEAFAVGVNVIFLNPIFRQNTVLRSRSAIVLDDPTAQCACN